MTRPKRVSIKGRGADLFFDDPTADPAHQPATEDLAKAIDETPVGNADATKQQSVLATNKARTRKDQMPPSRQPVAREDIGAEHPFGSPNPVADVALEAMWAAVAEPGVLSTTFRYAEEELSRLTDVLYELTKKTRARLSKQDIARIGLNVVLWDYDARGDASLLAQYAARRGKRR